jgi:hypothetical protein
VLYARDRGRTFPGCTAPAYHSEAHHRNGDWSQGGLTNIDDLTLACGTDNRRVNNYHHPERYLIPDEHATENSGDVDEGERP